MTHNFITNQKNVKTLKTRLGQLLEHSQELKFLSGFFYFSGWSQIYEALKQDKHITLKILVGLDVDVHLGHTIEYAQNNDDLTKNEQAELFFNSLKKAINNETLDSKDFYEQIYFFLEMIQEGRLHIRKTTEPNHAKLYIFKLKDALKTIGDSRFITGSSNLTAYGLERQNEFNVEISDYGTAEAESYFDDLWETALPITEHQDRKETLQDIITHQSQAALITPFEAYVFVLKTYLDLLEQKTIKPYIIDLLEKKNYRHYAYQTDAIKQALTIIEAYSGVIIADVVGLGKSIIGGLIAKCLNKRGMVICPPGLVGDKNGQTGWQKYKHDFELHDWEIRSSGTLEEIADYVKQQGQDIEVIIVDEAHRYRNEDTSAFEYLSHVCRNKIVILLTATPFNNSPADIFSLLKLFVIPGQSGITLDDNLEQRFTHYEKMFRDLSYIMKYYQSIDDDKKRRADKYYTDLDIGNLPIDITLVKKQALMLSKEIRKVLEPVIIRRNRIDLQKDFQYKQEIANLSKIKDPQELFFELSEQQSTFYDRVIRDYFSEKGLFKGAIYQPFNYEKDIDTLSVDKEENRELQQQKNLYDFMRRLLVKRFESSFGAFERTIESFERIHNIVLEFIEKTGKYVLDRKLIEKIYEDDADDIEKSLEEYSDNLAQSDNPIPKKYKVYQVNQFIKSENFIQDIQSDLELLRTIKKEINSFNLVANDPKAKRLVQYLKNSLATDPQRKIIIFTEYVDTAEHIKTKLSEIFLDNVLTIAGQVSKKDFENLNRNFDASVSKEQQNNQFNILIASDKISEGFNLNRAGTIINYDIPWNPTRVIQRVGRINRIGKKLFDELYLYNFFPTIQGAEIVKSREIAEQKMFLIHNTLGEDSKIFAINETPTASVLFKKINSFQEDEEESFQIQMRNEYETIKKQYPDTIKKIEKLPNRIKTAKQSEIYNLIVLRKKALGLFVHIHKDNQISEIQLEDVISYIRCPVDESKINLSENFWNNYDAIKEYKNNNRSRQPEHSLESKARNCLSCLLQYHSEKISENDRLFIDMLLKDIKEYMTLSKHSLRRLSQTEISDKSKKADIDSFIKVIQELKIHLGMDYLKRLKEQKIIQKKEVIIAIENYK